MKRAIVLMVIYFAITNLLSIPVIGLVAILSAVNATQAATGAVDVAAMQESIMSNPMMGTGISVVMLSAQLIMGIILWKGRTLKPIEDFGLKFSPIVFLLCIPMVVGFSYLMNCLSELLQLPNLIESQMESMMHSVWGILGIVVGAPVLEEMLFRGAIQGHFIRRGKSPLYAILVSSILFGLFHMNPAQIPFAAALGCVLGWIYYRTGSLWPSIFCHCINNGSAVLLALLFPEVDTMQQLVGDAQTEWMYAAIGLVAAAVAVWAITLYVPKPAPIPESEWDTTEVFPKKVQPVCAHVETDNSLS